MTDDQGWKDVGFNGNDLLQTPNLDSLAGMGVILDRFYSASAVCSPTRASVITGRNPLRMNIPTANSGHMPEMEWTIAEILKEAGYATGHFGKWHLGTFSKSEIDANRGGRSKFDSDFTIPTDHGYQSFFATESKVPTFDPMIYPAIFGEDEGKRFGWRAIEKGDSTKVYGTSYWNENGKVAPVELVGDNSKLIIDEVIKFIDSKDEESPFFSTIWLHTPHLPVVADSQSRAKYSHLPLDHQIYYGTITEMDHHIGRLWKHLGGLGIQEETIIMFCSDNGPERQTPGSAGIFRARKRSLYEGGVRVPAFAMWKGHFSGGHRSSFPAFTSDYLPTILDLLNLEYKYDRPLDGISIAEVLKGEVENRQKPMGFIFGKQVTWVSQKYKLKTDKSFQALELYDLENDLSESQNIAKENPKIVEKMKGELEIWLASVQESANGRDY